MSIDEEEKGDDYIKRRQTFLLVQSCSTVMLILNNFLKNFSPVVISPLVIITTFLSLQTVLWNIVLL